MSQTTAPKREMALGRVGLIAEPFGPEDIRSKVNPSGKSYFGRLVIQGAGGDERIAHPAAAIADLKTIMGTVVSTQAITSQNDSDDPNYPATDAVNVMRKGYMWVAITEDVAVGDPVFVLGSTGDEGKFAMSSGGATDTDISTVARWAKGGLAADGIALLELNLI